MELLEKLSILADAAKYDVSCSSSGSTRKNTPGGIGNGAVAGICHSWSDDGRCISLLKILFTNYCIYDCVYCINRSSNDRPRAAFTPRELADLTINFYRRNYIEGLFLSSAVMKNPDYTMELLLKTVRILREDYRFNGYIHLKAIPGADLSLIAQAGKYADRMSVNIELPSRKSLNLLAPEKKYNDILTPMESIGQGIRENQEERRYSRKTDSFVPAGQSTQVIVGASPEPDYYILKISEGLYKRFNMKRVYYSAYVPVNNNSLLPVLKNPPFLREHRLYQADWLLRFYRFKADELLTREKPNFDIQLDPKANWALNHLELFPVEINKADYELLLRVPGIGVKSARRILTARRNGAITFFDLKKFGTALKRARYFITCQGRYYGGIPIREDLIKNRLVSGVDSQQLSLFSQQADSWTNIDNSLNLQDDLMEDTNGTNGKVSGQVNS